MNKLDTKTRQKQILDASLNLIKEGGIQNLTMKRISQKVGISEQAIYRHYHSKQDILCTIIKYFNTHFETVFETVKKIDAIDERIQAFMDGHMNYFQANPATAAVIFSEEIFQYDSTLAQKINRLVERRIEVITNFVKSAQAEGKFNPELKADDVAYVILGSLRFLVTTWRLGGFKGDIRIKGKSMQATLLHLIS